MGQLERGTDMKKVAAVMMIILIALMLFSNNFVYAETTTAESTDSDSQLIKIKENSAKTLDEYKEKYGSDAYGLTAFILNIIRIYSIPFCFLGIAISAIYQYIIGIRKLDNQEKGLVLMVSFVTILVICQILPLAFAVVVKFGRG